MRFFFFFSKSSTRKIRVCLCNLLNIRDLVLFVCCCCFASYDDTKYVSLFATVLKYSNVCPFAKTVNHVAFFCCCCFFPTYNSSTTTSSSSQPSRLRLTQHHYHHPPRHDDDHQATPILLSAKFPTQTTVLTGSLHLDQSLKSLPTQPIRDGPGK